MDDDPVIGLMKASGVPITRENYIAHNWVDGIPEPWTAEHEDQLPEELQDWSQFERKKRKSRHRNKEA